MRLWIMLFCSRDGWVFLFRSNANVVHNANVDYAVNVDVIMGSGVIGYVSM